MTDLERELRKVVEGEVRFDAYSRLLYSTDASMYRVEPVGVVIPRHAGDVPAVLEVANRSGTPVLPRGGGTSLTGQTVNRAIVVDFSPHMNRLLELNAEEGWARVEPGLVQDELNHLVRPHGLLFGPDTATSNRATLGGMLGNNSGGAHSIAYGLTVDHVLELRVLLADGTEAVLRELGPAELGAGAAAPGLLGQIHREAARIGREYGEEIRARYPAYWRRVAGYNLTELVADRPLNLARLVVGSEGTLLTIVEAKVRLVPRPRQPRAVGPDGLRRGRPGRHPDRRVRGRGRARGAGPARGAPAMPGTGALRLRGARRPRPGLAELPDRLLLGRVE